jgi:predicted nuclease of predicted toxin-antitoxin system
MGSLASELAPWRADHAAGPLIYADANVPAPLVSWMRRTLHWDVLHVIDEPGWRRAPDRAHYDRARDLGRTLVTLDHDFLDDRRFPPALSPGVVVLEAPDSRGLQTLLVEVDSYLRAQPSKVTPLAGHKLSVGPGWNAASVR